MNKRKKKKMYAYVTSTWARRFVSQNRAWKVSKVSHMPGELPAARDILFFSLDNIFLLARDGLYRSLGLTEENGQRGSIIPTLYFT